MDPGTALSTVFCERVGVSLPSIEPLLSALCERGRQAWPALALEPKIFVEHLARHAKAASDPMVFLQSVHAEDLWLACAMLQGFRVALEAFEQKLISQIGLYLVRVSVDRELIAEVKQRVRQLVMFGENAAPKIAEYSGNGALGGWLRITSVRTALNLLRSNSVKPSIDEAPPMVVLDPELAYVNAQTQHVFREAFSKAIEQLEPNERSLLRFHYVDGLTMDQLSRMFQTPRSTIARRVNDVRKLILESTERLLANQHRLSPSEVASLIQRSRSQLHLTLGKFLKS